MPPALLDRPAADFLDEPALRPPPLLCGSLPLPDDGWTRDPARGVELLHIARIIPDPEQPRKRIDPAELARLADSVRRRGVLQPLRVQWLPERGFWMLVAGERRWQAAIAAGLMAVPAVRANAALTEAEALAEQLAEQLLRADLDPIEQARAYRRLIVLSGWTQQRLCAECQLEPSTVSRTLRLLDLDPAVQVDVAAGRIVPAAAAELVRLPAGGPQRAAAATIIADGLTATGAAELVGRLVGGERPVTGINRPRTPRVVIPIATGKVIVQAAGDVVANLHAAIAVHRGEQRAAA